VQARLGGDFCSLKMSRACTQHRRPISGQRRQQQYIVVSQSTSPHLLLLLLLALLS